MTSLLSRCVDDCLPRLCVRTQKTPAFDTTQRQLTWTGRKCKEAVEFAHYIDQLKVSLFLGSEARSVHCCQIVSTSTAISVPFSGDRHRAELNTSSDESGHASNLRHDPKRPFGK